MIGAPLPIDALAVLAKHGVMTLTATRPDVPALVPLVAGEPVRGTWWSHPSGNAIFNTASDLEDHADVLTMKLIDGKVTFVHRALFAPLYRVLTDAGVVAERSRKLGAEARRWLAQTEREGVVRPGKALDKKTKAELERAALAIVAQEHTESGKHVAVLRSLSSWADVDTKKAAKKLGLDEARARLGAHHLAL